MTVWVVVGGGQRIDIFAAAMQRRRKLPITIGAYGEGGAPIDNDGQGIWYQDYGCAPDSPTHVYHGWFFPAVPPCCCTMPPGSAATSMLIKFQKYLVEGIATDGIKG